MRVLVQDEPVGASTGRTWVTVCPRTVLVRRSARAAALGELRVGRVVSVWTRVIKDSDPMQAFADTLVIEHGPPR